MNISALTVLVLCVRGCGVPRELRSGFCGYYPTVDYGELDFIIRFIFSITVIVILYILILLSNISFFIDSLEKSNAVVHIID